MIFIKFCHGHIYIMISESDYYHVVKNKAIFISRCQGDIYKMWSMSQNFILELEKI